MFLLTRCMYIDSGLPNLCENTVDSEIFAEVLFSRNFALRDSPEAMCCFFEPDIIIISSAYWCIPNNRPKMTAFLLGRKASTQTKHKLSKTKISHS